MDSTNDLQDTAPAVLLSLLLPLVHPLPMATDLHLLPSPPALKATDTVRLTARLRLLSPRPLATDKAPALPPLLKSPHPLLPPLPRSLRPAPPATETAVATTVRPALQLPPLSPLPALMEVVTVTSLPLQALLPTAAVVTAVTATAESPLLRALPPTAAVVKVATATAESPLLRAPRHTAAVASTEAAPRAERAMAATTASSVFKQLRRAYRARGFYSMPVITHFL